VDLTSWSSVHQRTAEPFEPLTPAFAGETFPHTTGYAMWRLPEGGAAVPQARALVRGALAALGLPASGVEDGELMACEIATNAVRHAHGPYELRIYAFPDAVVCEVLDSSAASLETVRGALAEPLALAGRPVPMERAWATDLDWPSDADSPDALDLLIDSLAEGGRGLPLVGRLCAGRCGVRNASTVDSPPASGKAVWFTQVRPTDTGAGGRLTG
jgi:anti-sigma regulatory factor (Ser/Thr protein kinase)